MKNLVCPIISTGSEEKNCIAERCVMFVEGDSSNYCGLIKLSRKSVIRLDALSAQIQEIQILLNQIEGKIK